MALLIGIGLLGLGASSAPAGAQTLTQDQALALAFPGAEWARCTAYLDVSQLARVSEYAGPGVEPGSGVVTYYVATRAGDTLGVAYFDAHRVRTLSEVLMIIVGTDDRIRRIETVRFREPPEYRPRDGWLRQFDGRALDDELAMKRGIRGISGATLSSRAVTEAVRRVLATHELLYGAEAGRPEAAAGGGP